MGGVLSGLYDVRFRRGMATGLVLFFCAASGAILLLMDLAM